MNFDQADPFDRMIQALVDELAAARDGAYYVRFGTIDWSAWSQEQTGKSRAISVVVEEQNLFEDPSIANSFEASISIDAKAITSEEGTDANLYSEMRNDIRNALIRLARKKVNGHSVIKALNRSGQSTIFAHVDPTNELQGVNVMFDVVY